MKGSGKALSRLSLLAILSGAIWLAENNPAFADCIDDCIQGQRQCEIGCDFQYPNQGEPNHVNEWSACYCDCLEGKNLCIGTCPP
jgi:hypothetical protein